jgi:4-amino-4-deoxy-L-arabinose transferase-like glycosyltransferase
MPLRLLPFFALLVVYVVGALAIDVMDIDAAQYANIAREMADNNNFLEVQYRGEDYYLDKPPLLFWLSAVVFKLFGASNFAYRLFPILSTMLGMYALYRFAKLYYSAQTATIAALVMGSCQAFFLMNHDVRCDTLLTNCVTVAFWQIAAFRQTQRWANLLLGAVFVGLAMLAKGPIGLIVVGAGFSIDFVLKRDWKALFDWRWLVAAAMVGVVLLPYCVGLYRQYGTEGLYFFFWKQSFGRITGESDWANSPGLQFQAQNFLWSFLPWVLVFVPALIAAFREVIKAKFKLSSQQEAISLAGFVLPFAALSTAQYQLPHYTFVVFPLAALITARYLSDLLAPTLSETQQTTFKWLRGGLIFTAGIMVFVVAALCTWAFPLRNIWLAGLLVFLALLAFRLFGNARPRFSQLVFAPFVVAVTANLALNAHVYPTLLTYQTGSQLGHYLKKSNIDLQRFYLYDANPPENFYLFHDALDFYTRRITPILRTPNDLPPKGDCWLYTDQKGLEDISATGRKTEVLKTYDKFHVTGLTLPFLNPATRLTQTQKVFLVKVDTVD